MRNTADKSFREGYKWYSEIQIDLTNGEIEMLFPNVDLKAFAQGMEDAKYNDKFRLGRNGHA